MHASSILKAWLKEKKTSIRSLAKKSKLNYSSVKKYVAGKRSPSAANLEKLFMATGLPSLEPAPLFAVPLATTLAEALPRPDVSSPLCIKVLIDSRLTNGEGRSALNIIHEESGLAGYYVGTTKLIPKTAVSQLNPADLLLTVGLDSPKKTNPKMRIPRDAGIPTHFLHVADDLATFRENVRLALADLKKKSQHYRELKDSASLDIAKPLLIALEHHGLPPTIGKSLQMAARGLPKLTSSSAEQLVLLYLGRNA